MKITELLVLTLAIPLLTTALAQENMENNPSFPLLEGPYLGQKPPGLTPEPFAPGIVSTELYELFSAFTPDMKEFYFVRYDENDEPNMIVITYQNDRWHKSVVGPRIGEPFISSDGKTMYLGKQYMERTGTDWSEVKSIGPPFEDIPVMRLTTSSKGTYFFDAASGEIPIQFSRLIDGQREEPKTLKLDLGKFNAHPFIAPDESYLIWDDQRDSGYGKADIYISFRQQDDSWGPALNLGDQVNSGQSDSYATVTPDGKYLFFNRGIDENNVDIYWVDAQVIENLRPKNNENSTSTSHTIAYGSNGICLTDSEGKSKVRLTTGDDGYPAWSPDGKHIAMYAYHDEKKTWSIHTINSDGTNRERLTHAKNKWDNMPTWSPDGTKIVFAREYSDSEKIWHPEIWIMNSDGSEQTQIASLSGGGPCFLQDGRLLFHSEFKNKESEISIADIDGRNLIHLTDNEAEEWDPKISPDGRRIAFTSDRDGNHEIYVMNVDGSNQKRLTNNDVDDYGPSWSPDGFQLIFQSKRNEKSDLYIMNTDGSSVRKIISNGWQPAWLNLHN